MDQIVISDALKTKPAAAATPEDVVRYCNDEEFPITIEQLEAFAASEGDELSEAALDNVDGGCVRLIGGIWRIIPRRLFPKKPKLF